MKIQLPKLRRKHYISLSLITIGILLITGTLYTNSLSYNPVSAPPEINAYYISQYEPAVTLEEVYAEIESRRAEVAAIQNSAYVSGTSSWSNYPDEILETTRSGNDLLVLVNKKYQLPFTYEPADLVNVSTSGIRVTRSDLYIRSIVVTHLSSLVSDIEAEGINIAALSVYRSYGGQQATYNYWLSYNGGNVSTTDTICARAGHSQHQLGTTVDFTTSEIGDGLGQHFGDTAAGIWLAENSWEYGFVLAYPSGYESVTGYSYEPWHFRYIGVENASTWKASGQILESWLRDVNGV